VDNVFNGNVTIKQGGHISFIGNRVLGSMTVKGKGCDGDNDSECDIIIHENVFFGPLKVQNRDGFVVVMRNTVKSGDATFKNLDDFLWIIDLEVSDGNLECQNNTSLSVIENNYVPNGTDTCIGNVDP